MSGRTTWCDAKLNPLEVIEYLDVRIAKLGRAFGPLGYNGAFQLGLLSTYYLGESNTQVVMGHGDHQTIRGLQT